MSVRGLIALFVPGIVASASTALAELPEPTRKPLVRVVDLDVGEDAEVELCDGSRATVKLLDLKESRDSVRGAVRKAVATVQVNDGRTELVAATYHLPTTIAGVRIDCAVTKGYIEASSKEDVWRLAKDARLRLWPAGSPLVDPATFSYPVKLKWFSSDTQMANVPVHAKDGYTVTTHRFERPGHYLVRVEHTGASGAKATARLHVLVEEGKDGK